MANPNFSFKQFTIRQDRCAMKVTTDSCILGAYADFQNPSYILDIGSGSGVLTLMAAQKFARSHIHGVEIDKEAYEQSVYNVKNSPWSKRISLFQEKIQDFQGKGINYDLILCNPPYYQNQLNTKNKRKNIARHSHFLKIEELAHVVKELLAPQGVFYVILPIDFSRKIKDQLSIYGLELFDRLRISHKKGKSFYAITSGFSRISRDLTENTLYITDEENNYSPKFKKLLKEYYLAF